MAVQCSLRTERFCSAAHSSRACTTLVRQYPSLVRKLILVVLALVAAGCTDTSRAGVLAIVFTPRHDVNISSVMADPNADS
ncbi:MAG: hypothetical protein JWM95_3147, partial [Gemmatimonadetes bacterium]|nr:hypothetical protein [Gemmatimonadota bacterium]